MPVRNRPAVVTGATWLLHTVAFLVVLEAGVALFVVHDALGDSAVQDLESGEFRAEAYYVVLATIHILVGALISLLAIFTAQGRNPARILTLMVGLLGLGYTGVEWAGNFEEFDGELPTTGFGLFALLSAIAIVTGMLAALIALVLPAANRFFKKQPAPATPMPPDGPYPVSASPADQYWTPPPAPGRPAEPHTTSTPAIDPWAAGNPSGGPPPGPPPAEPSDDTYRPRHGRH